ncbi:hypothetical protein POM88_008745 [Heracleum sosnowskyi]|uniref:F-box associated beta-propeller type 3 domain-containing protein n=1 Tax=Heracleum sosnowskyi TaxID=360622 RepID=A0AAD8N7K0_9APIA|nr:hypothetical protein POM88_008745 [Heracleum sosnowskyi]
MSKSGGNNPTLLEIQVPQVEEEEEEEEEEEPDEDVLLQREQVRHQHLFEALLDVNFSLTLSSSLNDIYLWNPSIRQCKKLPPPKRCTDSVYVVESGFGYDSISDDYMVIRIVRDSILDVSAPTLQLYSSNSDSWTETQFHPFTMEDEIYCLGTTVVINGILYCACVNKLVSFDLRKQVIVLVPFPSSVQRRISNILDFKGSVALVFESGSQVDLWTLDDISDKVSWTKRFGIEADLKLVMYLRCFLGAGHFYGCKWINRMLLFNFFYDYENRVTKYYRLGEDLNFSTFNYTETLVTLNGFKRVE